MVRGIANSKIGFGDLILLLRYFFKLKVSTHPNDLTKKLHQAQERIKELEQINISESEFKKISTVNSRLLTLIGAMLCESNKRGLRSINQAGIVSEIANMQIPNLSKRVIDEFFSEANKKFKPYKTNS